LAFALTQSGNWSEALIHYQKAADLAPNDADNLNDLGVAFMRNEQTEKGIQCLQKAIQLNPSSLDAQKNLTIAIKIAEKK